MMSVCLDTYLLRPITTPPPNKSTEEINTEVFEQVVVGSHTAWLHDATILC